MRLPRLTSAVLTACVFLGVTVVGTPHASAAVSCSISNSALVLHNLFSIWYIDAVRTGGSCVDETGTPAIPYTCDVLGVVIGDVAGPPAVFGASLADPLENYCEALSSPSLVLRNCQEWLVISRFVPYDGTQHGTRSYEYACD